MKLNQKCYCLYVNVTSNYISFKIEDAKFLGKCPEELSTLANKENYYIVEHTDDEVNYLRKEDIFITEKAALKKLVKILQNKLEK